jgi:hypothetical protein
VSVFAVAAPVRTGSVTAHRTAVTPRPVISDWGDASEDVLEQHATRRGTESVLDVVRNIFRAISDDTKTLLSGGSGNRNRQSRV